VKSLPLITIAATLAVAGGAALPAPAQAQESCAPKAKKRGFGIFGSGGQGLVASIEGAVRGNRDLKADLEESARREAAGGVDTTVAAAGCRATRPADSAADGEPQPAAARRETSTERARREQTIADAKYPSRMPIPAEWKAAKDAYDAFGKVKCFGCEGGYAYAGWPSWPRDEFDGKYNGSETRLSRLPIGHVHRWTSNGFAGTLKVDGEGQVNGFRCRKMTYRLERDGKSAERPGLICWGKANEYAGSDSWVGVF